MARVEAVTGHARLALDEGWEVASTPPGAAERPSALDAIGLAWLAARAPGTVASALRDAGRLDLDAPPKLDDQDHWWRRRFVLPMSEGPASHAIVLEGLATLADVFLDGEIVVRSESMFEAHRVDVTSRLRPGATHEIAIRFRALGPWLAQKRPRPRWKTRLVEAQSLRFARTTLLGRMPGWTPAIAPVGPWRPVAIETRVGFVVESAAVRARIDGADGVLEASIELRVIDGATVDGATIVVGDARAPLAVEAGGAGRFTLRGEAVLRDPPRWWPHTHGPQPRFPVRVEVLGRTIDLGHAAFRAVDLRDDDGGFGLAVNGVEVFCRGAVWTTADVVSLAGDEAAVRPALLAARAAGMNLIRVGGTMVYESDAFYEACDELGLLVWQDFQFANLDYPVNDEAFAAAARREAAQLLDRVELRASLAVLCGGSEVEQQAAMMGLPREAWSSALFQEILPGATRARRPDVAYVPSTPTGGTLPFQVDTGVSHYYGVGAYLRPLEDARRANVRFAAECLAFANVPDPATIDGLLGPGESPVHHPRWKARVPRDRGPGWDFEDVRDHYVALIFGVDPMRLRYADMGRYLALARVATGEVMARTFAEWRRARSTCRGAIVWTLQDVWPGAGFGVIDALGTPKAAYFYLRRALAPRALSLADEGSSGLYAHAHNDRPEPLDATLRVTLHRGGRAVVATGERDLVVPARASAEVHVDALFPSFLDTTYAFRFGPPGHDVVVATLHDRATGDRVADAFYFPTGLPASPRDDLGLEASARAIGEGRYALTLRSRALALAVAVDAPGFDADDGYVTVPPEGDRVIHLAARAPGKALAGWVAALNGATPVRIDLGRAR